MELQKACVLLFCLVSCLTLGWVDCGPTGDDSGEILRRLESLEKRDNEQNEVIERLQATIKEQNQIITGLSENADVQNVLSVILQEKIIVQKDITKSLTEKVEKQNDEVLAQTKENSNLKAFMEKQQADIDQLKQLAKFATHDKSDYLKYTPVARNENEANAFDTPNAGGKVIFGRQVAFHARIDRKEIAHIPSGQTLVFDVVKMNIGNGYHTNGVFHAPSSGVYFFSVSICILHSGKEIHAELMRNGHQIAGAYANGAGQGSVSAVVHLNFNDAVWVSALHHQNTYMYGATLTSFMGFKLS